MTKYTIIKVFDKNFPHEIWKIVADVSTRQIGVELRDTETTCAVLYVFDFEGNEILHHCPLDEKEWTLEALQHHTLVLKRVGDSQPIKEGVLLLDLQGMPRQLWQEYTWIDTYRDIIKVRHRSFQSGFEEYIHLESLQKTTVLTDRPKYSSAIKMPIPYSGTVPPYLQGIAMQDIPWVSRTEEHFLWTYHTRENDTYHLNLCVADASKLLFKQRLLKDMPKMIPQPYFQIGNQMFLMSYNKQKIISYLV